MAEVSCVYIYMYLIGSAIIWLSLRNILQMNVGISNMISGIFLNEAMNWALWELLQRSFVALVFLQAGSPLGPDAGICMKPPESLD